MKQVLAGRDFRNLEPPSRRDSFLEKLSAWLNQFFQSVAKLHASSVWVGRVMVWGFTTPSSRITDVPTAPRFAKSWSTVLK